MGNIIYAIESELSSDEFIDILQRSTLAARRPVSNRDKINTMLRNADIILTAREDEKLVGISRAISDFAYCTYLSELAVDQAFQGRGIGKELIRRTHEFAGRHTRLLLLAAPSAESYYGHIGLEKHNSCWFLMPSSDSN